jgi:hypothetical protein
MEETEEREAAALLGSLSLSLSLSLLKRVADVPAHPLERMRKHSSILGVGIIIIFRKYAHVPSRGRSGNGLQNLLETELQHILLQDQQGLGIPFSVNLYKHVLVLHCQHVSTRRQITSRQRSAKTRQSVANEFARISLVLFV